ncbi:hypothetical protein ERJ75_000089700 [Trypanosoma vivax]|nr:hypothetical protein ERJ75_001672200 [Trypanosoma vivax]KAH8620183.1 hypothetical protein ERJ75_000089700 [Trypanosoma vivax]
MLSERVARVGVGGQIRALSAVRSGTVTNSRRTPTLACKHILPLWTVKITTRSKGFASRKVKSTYARERQKRPGRQRNARGWGWTFESLEGPSGHRNARLERAKERTQRSVAAAVCGDATPCARYRQTAATAENNNPLVANVGFHGIQGLQDKLEKTSLKPEEGICTCGGVLGRLTGSSPEHLFAACRDAFPLLPSPGFSLKDAWEKMTLWAWAVGEMALAEGLHRPGARAYNRRRPLRAKSARIHA